MKIKTILIKSTRANVCR